MKAQRKKLLSLKFREYRQNRIIIALLLAALFMIVLLPCRQLSGALIPIASQDSRVEQGERDLSGIWDGSLSFNFAGEIVEGHLTLILRQHLLSQKVPALAFTPVFSAVILGSIGLTFFGWLLYKRRML